MDSFSDSDDDQGLDHLPKKRKISADDEESDEKCSYSQISGLDRLSKKRKISDGDDESDAESCFSQLRLDLLSKNLKIIDDDEENDKQSTYSKLTEDCCKQSAALEKITAQLEKQTELLTALHRDTVVWNMKIFNELKTYHLTKQWENEINGEKKAMENL